MCRGAPNAPYAYTIWYRVLRLGCFARVGCCDFFFLISILPQIPGTLIISLGKAMFIRNGCLGNVLKPRL